MKSKAYKLWHLWSDALGSKADVNNNEHSDLVAMIRTFMFVSIFVTNMVIVAGVIRHWNDLKVRDDIEQYD
jgi:hypothetical protein